MLNSGLVQCFIEFLDLLDRDVLVRATEETEYRVFDVLRCLQHGSFARAHIPTQASVEGNHARQVRGVRARLRLDVSEMRSRLSFRPVTQKEDVYPAQRLKLQKIERKRAFQIISVGLHRREALDLFEEGFSEQTLEVAHETEAVLHAHRRERVLRKDVQASEQIIYL